MAKLIRSMITPLDGFVSTADGGFGWNAGAYSGHLDGLRAELEMPDMRRFSNSAVHPSHRVVA